MSINEKIAETEAHKVLLKSLDDYGFEEKNAFTYYKIKKWYIDSLMMGYEYNSELDIYNVPLKDYLTKMNVGGIYSYLMFMENMSDEYVQVDIDKMIRKELLELTEEDLRTMKKTISLLLNNFECIDTRTFNGYSMFPTLKYKWNK